MPSQCGKGPAGAICMVAGDVSSRIGHAVASAAGSVTGSVLHDVASAMADGATALLKTLSSFWMNVDTPQLTGASSPVTAIISGTGWITAAGAVVCVLVAGARIAIRRRGEPGTAVALGLARLVAVSAVAAFLVQLAGQAGDEWSAALMSAAHVGSNGWSGIISVTALSAAFAPGDGILLIVALLIILASLVQLMLMVLRVGLLIVLTGTLPLAAAAAMSDWGETWWRKHLGWLVAWLLYKPTAALLYASAFILTEGKRSLVEVTAGFMLLVLMVFIMPALLRVIAPATASLGAGSGGALALGAAGAIATGAIRLGGIGGIRSMVSGRGGGSPGNSGTAAGGSGEPSGSPGPAAGGGNNRPGDPGTTAEDATPPPGSTPFSPERTSGDSPASSGSGIPGQAEDAAPGSDPGSSYTGTESPAWDSQPGPWPGGTDRPAPQTGATTPTETGLPAGGTSPATGVSPVNGPPPGPDGIPRQPIYRRKF